MKPANIFFPMLLMAFVASGAFAQDEYDDMYFNSKDRAKVLASRSTLEPKTEKKVKAKDADDEINPTDSYSARSVNPEFTSRSNSESAQADNEDYFVSNYKVQTQSQFNNWNRNYNSWYNDPWYSSAYFGSGINRWNSPYYGSYYSPYSSPWYDPYYTNGWSSSFSYYYGSNWNYGWGMNYGYGCPNNYWNNSWYSPYYSSWYSPFNSYSPYGYYGYNSPVIVVIGENNNRGPVYGKRSTRGTSFAQNNTGERERSSYTTTRTSGNSNGRVSTRKQDEYYQRTWQQTGGTDTRQDSRTTTQHNRSSSWSTGNNNAGNNASWGNSRSSSSTGGATRSHSGGSGSGSNGRSRGRD
jgi:hypothetical protein